MNKTDITNYLSNIKFFANHSYEEIDVTTSTNDDLKLDWDKSFFVPKILVTKHQTAGRGQYNRKWESDYGKSLLFSFSEKIYIEDFPLSLRAGISVVAGLSNLMKSSKIWLKWPNDIYYERRKLGGILVECCTKSKENSYYIVGIGLNISQQAFVESACLDEIQPSINKQRLLISILESWSNSFNKNSSKLKEIWTSYAGIFWKKKFLLKQNNLQAITVIPKYLHSDGKLNVSDLSSKKEFNLVSEKITPIFD